MAETNRFEIVLPATQRQALAGLAEETGVSSSGLARLAISHLLARNELLLGGAPVGPGGDLDAFLVELRADPILASVADQLGAAFSSLDMEAGINRDAAGLFECLQIVARARGPIEKRLRVMLELIDHDGVVSIPRSLLANHTQPKIASP
jgi:hypothetical protein